MADQVITKQELIDAQKDAQSLDDFINGGDEQIVVTRLLKEYPTLANAIRQIYEKGGKFYPTLAGANADIANIRTDIYVITGDNGAYYKATAGATTLTKSVYDPLQQAKDFANANPRFTPRYLVSGENLNNLPSGVFFIQSAAIAATLLNFPADLITNPDVAIVRCDRSPDKHMPYQEIIRYTETGGYIEKVERVSSGGSSATMVWLPWRKQASLKDTDALAELINAKPSINLFKDIEFGGVGALTYEAQSVLKDGVFTAVMDNTKISAMFYDYDIDGFFLKLGKSISLSVEINSDSTASTSGDIRIDALDGVGSILLSSSTARANQAGAFHLIATAITLPENTAKVRFRFTRRSGNTYVEFRKPKVTSSALIKDVSPVFQSLPVSRIVYVAKTGSDANNGSFEKPFLTIQRAANYLYNTGGEIKVLDDADYREPVVINSYVTIKISAAYNKRVNVFGSNQLVVTKTAGFTKIYQAPLANYPLGMGGARGAPKIFEWGTPSKPILEEDRHYLHRGRTHRLPYFEMFEASTKAELDTVSGNGKWWWEDGIIYFSASDGSDATLKRYEARARPCIIHTNGSMELHRVDLWFSSSSGVQSNGIYQKRFECRAFGAVRDGFSDDNNLTETYFDESAGCDTDGINGTVTDFTAGFKDENTRLTALYSEPYTHDNGDDGLSFHYRGDSHVKGGLGEYNTKADFVQVNGASCSCEGTTARGTTNGFLAASPATGDARTKTVFECRNTISLKNANSYAAQDDAELHLINPIIEDPSVIGLKQTGSGAIKISGQALYKGDPDKIKSGNVIIDTYTQVI